ncbi:MAG: hypothetical protein IJ895_02425, partial [Prevotella sp.]|nr:hypothetical protein [Prevotella sp.]
RIKINEMPDITIPDNNTVTTTLPASGEYTIRRTSSESYLYYIALSPIATGITYVNGNFQSSIFNPQSYNLAGQRVSDGYHGIVIRNGKKVVR